MDGYAPAMDVFLGGGGRGVDSRSCDIVYIGIDYPVGRTKPSTSGGGGGVRGGM